MKDKLIDMHVHSLECGIMCAGDVDVTFETVTKGLQEYHVEKACLMPINDISWQPVKAMNDYLVEIVKTHPDYVGFIDIDITRAHFYRGIKEMESEIEYYHSKGLKGIKIHPQNLGVKADDWRLLPIYRLAGELKIPVIIHCYPGSSPGLQDDSDPRAIEKVVRVFHKTTFIIAHFGGVKYFYDMEYLNYENVYFETSGVMPKLEAYFGIDKIKVVFDEIGYDKIMFGSDYPTESITETLRILKLVVPEEKQGEVFYGNADRLGRKFGWWEKD
ncbi:MULTISPECIES: amidohydrolase family protein [unclassified Fusibacter]|uniref:amidohydrolase family protein n=1 Tax=unclassified Fusibacter TaxID=2624464 RepID=UPI001010260E|nr:MULTISPECIES: amidohydrolase family protein [unclassified Fusibacter]MCK8061566.1 amidohydrolase family protein [Fusibacter sp. A2]NPE23706.1 amidohydrolase family protein [Fusibacter sp. A1]RXV58733.1 hypothetical protein DWB64_18135 [Fusibacter sp. A1]